MAAGIPSFHPPSISSLTQPPTFEYRNCGLCASQNAPVKCECQATHYCDKECQRKDKEAHRGRCTYMLCKDIQKKKSELHVLKAQQNYSLAGKLTFSWLSCISSWAGSCFVLNCRVTTRFWKSISSSRARFIASWRLWQSRVGQETRKCSLTTRLPHFNVWAHSIVLGTERTMRWRYTRMRLIGCATIRARMAARLSGKKYSLLPSALNAKHTITNTNHQYQRQGRGPDKKKCRAAQALGEEALDINRTLNAQVDVLALDLTSQPSPILNQAHRELCTAEVLLNVARMYRDLEMFEQARGAVKEVLVLRCRRFGSESASVADCHGQVAHICNSQSVAIERSMSQKSSCFWPGSKVRVEGLQNYPQ